MPGSLYPVIAMGALLNRKTIKDSSSSMESNYQLKSSQECVEDVAMEHAMWGAIRRVTSIPDRDAFEKHGDALPTCITILLQKHALLLVGSDMPICISRHTSHLYRKIFAEISTARVAGTPPSSVGTCWEAQLPTEGPPVKGVCGIWAVFLSLLSCTLASAIAPSRVGQ